MAENTSKQTARRWKRTAILTLLLLAGGAVVNVAVAWGLAVLVSHNRWMSMRVGAVIYEDCGYWSNWRLESFGQIKISSFAGQSQAPESWDERWEDPAALIESWSLVPSHAMMIGRGTRWEELGSGWPAVSMWSRLYENDPLHNFHIPNRPVRQRILPRDVVERGYLVEWPRIRTQFVLPTGIHWPGFIINTLFYALLLWLLFFAPFAARRMLRRRRGLCEMCAYPVGTWGGSSVCTECGAAVAAGKR